MGLSARSRFQALLQQEYQEKKDRSRYDGLSWEELATEAGADVIGYENVWKGGD